MPFKIITAFKLVTLFLSVTRRLIRYTLRLTSVPDLIVKTPSQKISGGGGGWRQQRKYGNLMLQKQPSLIAVRPLYAAHSTHTACPQSSHIH
jgi:hypothetical protein